MNLSRRISKNSGFSLTGRLFTSVIAFAITAVLLPRVLADEAFGIFSFYLALYLLVVNGIDFGAGAIVTREASKDRSKAGRLLSLLLGLRSRFALVAFLLLGAVAVLFEGVSTRTALLACAAGHVFFHALSGAATIFVVDMDLRWQVASNLLGQMTWLVATLFLFLSGVVTPEPYLLAYGAGIVMTGTSAWIFAQRRVSINFTSSRAERLWLWKEAWPAGVSAIMAAIYFSIDTVMLRPLVGDVAVAHYAATYRLVMVVLMVPALLSQVAFPVLTRLWDQGGSEAVLPFFRRLSVALIALGILFPATIPFVSRDMLAVIYPLSFQEGAPSLGVLAFSVAAIFAAYPCMYLLLATGNQRSMMVISTVAAFFNIAANLLVIPPWGMLGAAWTTVATECMVFGGSAFCVWRLIGATLDMRFLLRPFACALFAAGILAVSAPFFSVGPEASSWWLASPAAHVGFGMAVGLAGFFASGVFPLDLGGEGGSPDEGEGKARAA